MSSKKPAPMSAEQAAAARMSTATRPVNTFERRAGLESQAIPLDKPSEAIKHDGVNAAGDKVAFVESANGIESEGPTANISKALADEKFMQEPVEIILASPGTEDEHRYVEVTVNGIRRCLPRDDSVVHVIPRCHLAVIAAAKVQRLVQTKITNADGSMGYAEKAVLQALYPFSVISDQNPKGSAWLRQVIARG